MKKLYVPLLLLVSLFAMQSSVNAVGLIPVPVLDNVTVNSVANFDSTTGQYRYNYELVNDASNTGDIWNIHLDVQYNIRTGQLQSNNLTIPFGESAVRTFSEYLNSRPPLNLPPGTLIVPFGQTAPVGWNGGFGRDGFLRFTAGSNGTKIVPGTTMSGFSVFSYGTPTIRTIRVLPDWVLVVENHDLVTDEQLNQAAAVESSIVFTTQTLGPSGLAIFGSDDHWLQLENDISRAITLGWITDAVLAQSLQAQLASARAALDLDDGTLAKERLQVVLTTLENSTDTQRNQEISDLISLNIQSLLANTPDTPIPFEPVYTLTPETFELQIGNEHTITAKVVNSADHDAPVTGRFVMLTVIEGPHAGRNWSGVTNENGEFSVSYLGTKTGADYIILEEEELARTIERKKRPIQLAALGGNLTMLLAGFRQYPWALAEAEVIWKAGPDLVVPFFMPPEIMSQGGKPVFITEVTENIGLTTAAPSTTRYYISDTNPVNPNTALVVGERRINTLISSETSDSNTTELQLPVDLQENVYYLAACADADNEVVELDENNNCSFSKLSTSDSNVTPGFPPTNSPPDCSNAILVPNFLWPPNHKFVAIEIQNVIDPDQDPVSIQITSVFQDELVNSAGDGNTIPDAIINDTNVQVRAERSGQLNGRVYVISFTANDGQNGTCSGQVTVGVPHDKGGQPAPINDGAIYDSTK